MVGFLTRYSSMRVVLVLMACVVSRGGGAANADDPVVTVMPLLLIEPSVEETTTELSSMGVPLTEPGDLNPGDKVYLEIWFQTVGPNGIASAVLNISYETAFLDTSVEQITLASLWMDLFAPFRVVDDPAGFITDVGGISVAGQGLDPHWAKLATIEFDVTATPSTRITACTHDGGPKRGFGMLGIGAVEKVDYRCTGCAEGVPGCCSSDDQCPPDPKCFDSYCDLATNTCMVSDKLSDCCTSDAQCPPDTKCFDSYCDLATNTCMVSDKLPDCCTSDDQCSHLDTKCQPGLCDFATNTCYTGPKTPPDCCETDDQCPPDEKSCDEGSCVECQGNPYCLCLLGIDGTPACASLSDGVFLPCVSDADCDALWMPGSKCFFDPCFDPVDTFCVFNCGTMDEKCVDHFCDLGTNTCDSAPIPGCCDSDNQCPPDTKCFDSYCDLATNTCQMSDKFPGCCDSDDQCPPDPECFDSFCDLTTNTCEMSDQLPDCCTESLRTLGTFVECLSGPDVTVGPECTCADIDQDGDVDLADFAAFQVSFSGP